MTPFSIAGVQMSLSANGGNVDAMIKKIDLTKAKFPWVQMIVFSELAACGPAVGRAETLPGPIENAFSKSAAAHNIWIIPGSVFEKTDGKIYNTASVIGPSGDIVQRYRKMFPFRPYELGVESGSEFCVFDVAGIGRFGISICYDMWFPETTRQLVSMGAEVILHPTMTDTIDRDVELSIARAMAATNQCFFFDINGCGDGGVGRSIVISPSGKVIHQAGAGEEIIPVEIDLDRVRRDRDVGISGLGQPLKSFRDRPANFPVYSDVERSEFFENLGPLAMPGDR